MKLTLAFSPCPNDTFIFDALVNKKIDTGELEFDVLLEDVQTLNEWTAAGKTDVSKISYGMLPQLISQYQVLNSGGALGEGVGPLLITGNQWPEYLTQETLNEKINSLTIAIPGEQTTAHLLFSLAFPDAKKKRFMLFSDIEDAVLNGEADAGVIIHENRFTYQLRGLHKIIDLGDYWERKTGSAIPLGGIVIRKTFPDAIKTRIDRLINESVSYALKRYPFVSDYVKLHAQEMDEAVMRKHIDLYVNHYSVNLGENGRQAVYTLIKTYDQLHQSKTNPGDIFVS